MGLWAPLLCVLGSGVWTGLLFLSLVRYVPAPLSLVRLRDPVECTLLYESWDLSLVSGYLN